MSPFSLLEELRAAMAQTAPEELVQLERAVRAAIQKALSPKPAALAGEGLIEIFCDGACSGNPGPGGWGAVIRQDGLEQELSGGAQRTTNNMMELTAAIEAVSLTPAQAQVQVTTDSQYVVKGMTEWIHGWKKRGWKKADGEPVLNQDYWQRLDEVCRERRVKWVWVKGHAGHRENERADELARGGIPKD